MNLSVFELAYLGSQAKDTPHSGKNKIFRFSTPQFFAEATDQQWMRQLGIVPQPDWSLATLLGLAEPAEIKKQLQVFGGKRLLLAQPVHFSLQRDSFGLDALVTLSSDEYLTLTKHLNDFFKEEGLTLIASATQRYWFLQTSTPWQIITQPTQVVMFQNVQGFMPQGEDAQKLRQVMNQVQMLLHEHPVNQARVANGLPEVNSIWFSGSGMMNVSTNPRPIALVGQHHLPKSIAEAFQLPYFAHIEDAVAQGDQDAMMLVDDVDTINWEALHVAVKTRKIHRLTMHLPVYGDTLFSGTLQLSLTPLDCWKFWRQPHSFETLIQRYAQNH
jgi:hypothetical protein